MRPAHLFGGGGFAVGYCLSVTLVDPKRLRAVPGSRDRRLMRRVLQRMKRVNPHWDEDANLLAKEIALWEIFDGRLSRPEWYSHYGWAWSDICEEIGRNLPVSNFAPCEAGFLAWLDEQLAPFAAPVEMVKLVSRPPMRLPEPNDWPSVGHWTAAEMRRLAGPLGRAIGQLANRRAVEALEEVRSWLAAARKRPGDMLVGFYG